ncbi:hypothetical protein FA039_30805 [Escherichia coli]|nr:hypothetical protein [Escherichia coli]
MPKSVPFIQNQSGHRGGLITCYGSAA